ncbi:MULTISPECIES: trigger factor [unclassified Microcoleus]|uniref:trigger factor n=1 Tax=unclassified Microcoleus TaxID=2642155 RepID=UPI001DCC01AE|nr:MULTISPECIES: trigger factor [unclassified Microcoleus]MCC3419541.1 trigger factor [Microcoleus sp. PH2017_07_MST_O_A]MCC3511400.1 trigger factor [Microcoleus sp. PH2017_17_BER_D_A]TAE43777.1 MAG: trigger factor [Oscillatoriales cyanobacterium]MCC3413417.1 trigger factor [Microcoleus sp. PH2017_02_FOX_O_A]MCC3425170.1 trigger factor [Microcoleus sp. PH2017_01_SCD_O_A]
MKVTQEKLPASQIGLEIEVPSEKSKQAYEQVIKQFAREVNIPGFRKGKVPRQVLLQRLGQTRLKATALENLINDSLQKALEQEKIPAIGSFELRTEFEELLGKFDPEQPLTFSAKVDVEPEVKMGQYTGLQLQAEEVKYDEAQVDEVLAKYRSDKATLIPVEGRPAQLGDMALVDFAGKFAEAAEGETPAEIPGGDAEDFQVELSENQFVPGFIQGMIGMNPGETREVSVQFPDEYSSEELAGKPAVFTITLKELKEKELPELDDDFAQEVSEFETLAQLRESLETRFKTEQENKLSVNKEKAISAALVQLIDVEIPATMVDREIDYLLNQQAMQLKNYGIDINQLFTEENIGPMRERSRPEAVERLKQTLALAEVAKLESLSVEPAEVVAEVAKVRKQFPKGNFDPEKLREFVAEDLLKQKTLKWLEEKGTIELLPEGSLTPAAEEEAEESDAEESAEAVTSAIDVEVVGQE